MTFAMWELYSLEYSTYAENTGAATQTIILLKHHYLNSAMNA